MQSTKLRVAIINDSRPAFHYGSLLVMDNLEVLLKEGGAEIVWSWPIGKDWRKHKMELQDRPPVDITIVNAEGVIHHGPRRWQAQSLAEFAAFSHDTLRAPSYLLNATLHENGTGVYEALHQYHGIYVRDLSSKALLESQDIAAAYVPDLTFAKPASLDYAPTDKIGVIDSVIQSDVPYLKKLSRARGFAYRSIIVARPAKYNPWKRPRKFLRETLKWLITDRHKSLDPQEFEAELVKYRLVVTGRYHAVTLCLKHRIPFVALESNTPKISYLLQDVFGDTRRIVRLEGLETLQTSTWDHYSNNESQAIRQFLVHAERANKEMIHSILNINVQNTAAGHA